MVEWWYAKNNLKCGPLTFKEIVSLFLQGDINNDTLVWTKGMSQWQPIQKVPAFFKKNQDEVDPSLKVPPQSIKPERAQYRHNTVMPTPEEKLKKIAPSSNLNYFFKTVVGKIITTTLVLALVIWMLYQKNLSDEKTNLIKQQAIEQNEKLEEARKNELAAKNALAQQREEAEKAKKLAAEAQAKADAETKSRLAAEEKLNSSVRSGADQTTTSGVNNSPLTACNDFASCLTNMFIASFPLRNDMLDQATSKILSLEKYSRRDQKLARDLNQKGLQSFNSNDYAAAVNLFKQAADADQGDAEVWANLGFAYVKNKQLDLATTVLGHALYINPRRTATWTAVAEYFSYNNEFDLSMRSLLLGYKYSGSFANTLKFYREKAEVEKNSVYQKAYLKAIDVISDKTSGYENLISSAANGSANTRNSSPPPNMEQLSYSHGTYYGEVKNGKADGMGTYTSKLSGTTYKGHFLNDSFNGRGVMEWKNGSKYVGEWVNDKGVNGQITFPDGRIANGTVINSVFNISR